jgi:subtilisin family serine protease
VIIRLLTTTVALLILVGSAIQAQAAGPSGSLQTTGEYVPGEIIVKLRSKSKSMQAQAFIGKSVSEKGMTLKGTWNGLNMHHFALKPGVSVEATIAEMKNDPDVEFVEPNYVVRMQSTGMEGTPVSMDVVREQSVNDVSAFSQTAAPIGEATGWTAQTVGLSPPVVAVIDTGIDPTHTVFASSGAVWTNSHEIASNQVDDDSNGYVDDVHGWNFVSNTNSPYDDDGHGTHVSGIILGVSQDITAAVLQPASIRIMPLKFLDSTGAGSTSDAVKAIYYAVNNGAKVLNNSWGGGGFSNSLLNAIAFAYDHKVVFVAAAGNASSNNDSTPTYPANYNVPNMISVAATTDADGWASFSNFGVSTVHVGSPGNSIYSTFPNNMWGHASGTSMATPFVAGMAALMVRESPTMTGYQVKSLIFSAGNQIAALATRTSTKNRIYVPGSISMAKAATVSASQPSYDVSAFRAPASDDSAGAQVPACGLVAKAIYDSRDGEGPSGPFRNLAFFGVLLILVSPILVSVALRNREDGKNKRRHERFDISSAVTMKFGDRELTGQVSSISMGGVQVDTDAWLENGGVITMSIASPDGKESISVQGKVVWSEEQKRYGVAFANAETSVKSTIARWTAGLMSS